MRRLNQHLPGKRIIVLSLSGKLDKLMKLNSILRTPLAVYNCYLRTVCNPLESQCLSIAKLLMNFKPLLYNATEICTKCLVSEKRYVYLKGTVCSLENQFGSKRFRVELMIKRFVYSHKKLHRKII